jgi:hypothetical protein
MKRRWSDDEAFSKRGKTSGLELDGVEKTSQHERD